MSRPLGVMASAVHISGGGGGTWTPASLAGLGAWYDPSDSGTVSVISTLVDTVANKEGTTARNLVQATAANKPTLLTASINGLDTLSFDGNNDYMHNGDNGFMYAAGAVTIGVIVKGSRLQDRYIFAEGSPSATQPVYSPLKTSNTAGNYTPSAWMRNTANTTIFAHGQNGTINFLDSPTAPHLITVVDTGSNLRHYVDGALSNDYNYTRIDPLTSTRFGLGALYRSSGIASLFQGEIAEIVISTAAQTQAEREKLEGYLAHRWGTTALLPGGHPYKTTAP